MYITNGGKLKTIIASSAKVSFCPILTYFSKIWRFFAKYQIQETFSLLFFALLYPSFYQQYVITEFLIDAAFPLTPFSESAVIFKKIKGVPRSRQNLCSFLDFENVTVYNKPTKSVMTASLKKKTFQIFLIKGKKRMLSNFSTKRLYNEKYKILKKSYFSFPLNWKGRIIRWLSLFFTCGTTALLLWSSDVIPVIVYLLFLSIVDLSLYPALFQWSTKLGNSWFKFIPRQASPFTGWWKKTTGGVIMALELFDGPSMPDECTQNDGGFNLVEFYASPTGKHDNTQLKFHISTIESRFNE